MRYREIVSLFLPNCLLIRLCYSEFVFKLFAAIISWTISNKCKVLLLKKTHLVCFSKFALKVDNNWRYDIQTTRDGIFVHIWHRQNECCTVRSFLFAFDRISSLVEFHQHCRTLHCWWFCFVLFCFVLFCIGNIFSCKSF